LSASKDDPAKDAKTGSGSGSNGAIVSTSSSPAVLDFGPSPSAAMSEAARGEEKLIEFGYPAFTAKFSSYGAELVSCGRPSV